jgi:hypothetical protein
MIVAARIGSSVSPLPGLLREVKGTDPSYAV